VLVLSVAGGFDESRRTLLETKNRFHIHELQSVLFSCIFQTICGRHCSGFQLRIELHLRSSSVKHWWSFRPQNTSGSSVFLHWASQVDEHCALQHVLHSHIQQLANTNPSHVLDLHGTILDLHGTISNFNLELYCFKYNRKTFSANLKMHLIRSLRQPWYSIFVRFLMCVHNSLVFSMLNCQLRDWSSTSCQGRNLFHAYCSTFASAYFNCMTTGTNVPAVLWFASVVLGFVKVVLVICPR